MDELLAHLVGDYIAQSDWMAQTKTGDPEGALAHAAAYTACFLPLTRDPRALAVIGGSHYLIDRYRLAKYLVWAKNQVAPQAYRYPLSQAGPHGYHQERPDWLAMWLLFIADNTVHMLINRCALRAFVRR